MPVSRNITLLGWFNFWAEFRLYGPIAILYYSEVSGSYALGMSIFSAAMLAQSLFEVPTGIFSDLIGRRKTVICGAVAGVFALFSFLLGALADHVGVIPALIVAVLLGTVPMVLYWRVLRPRVKSHAAAGE